MAHRIDFSRGFAALAYRGETPWHGLGQRMQPGASLDDWQTAAGMDYRICRAVVRFATARDGAGNPMDLRTMADRIVNFRSDTKAPLAVVSDEYEPVQPRECLEFFRDLSEAMGFQLETAGVLFGGRRYWALARVTSDVAIRDPADKVGGFCLISTSADGSLATSARFTTVRVVCNNTLSLAAGKNAKRAEFTLTHRAKFDADAAKAALGILRPDETREQFAASMELFRRMAATPLGGFDMADLTLRAFGYKPEEMSAKELTEAADRRAVKAVGTMAATGRGLAGGRLAGAGATAWGWLNSVTQYVDHHAQARSRDNRLDSAWNGKGDNLKRRALELVTERVGAAPVISTTYQNEVADSGVLSSVLASTLTA
jgi:phage/plasmid-like protein (TIGR03299 family)